MTTQTTPSTNVSRTVDDRDHVTVADLIEMNVYPKVFTNALVQLVSEKSIALHAPGSLVTDSFPVFFLLDVNHGVVIKYDLRDTMLDFADFTYMEEYEIVEELSNIEYIMTTAQVEQYVNFLINRELNTPHLDGLIKFLTVMRGLPTHD